MPMLDYGYLAASIALPLFVAGSLASKQRPEIEHWYPTLNKPKWTPPNWTFPVVWTMLYTAMGTAAWMVWRAGGGVVPLALYAVQLLLNFAWTPLFFLQHRLGPALLNISVLLGVLVVTVHEFYRVSPIAAYLLIPYLLWSSYATALNFWIWKHNPTYDKNGTKSAGTPSSGYATKSQ